MKLYKINVFCFMFNSFSNLLAQIIICKFVNFKLSNARLNK